MIAISEPHADVVIPGLDVPFMLLPFRPTSDPSAARTFIRNYFDKGQALHGEHLAQELRLTEPMVRTKLLELDDPAYNF